MLQRLGWILLIFLCLAQPALAQNSTREQRFLRGDAIINGPYTTRGDEGLSAKGNPLNRLRSDSFRALVRKSLSPIAVRVSVARTFRARSQSIRSSKLHSPCNEPVIKRLLRVSKSLTCEPNYEVKLTATPNDPLYSSMYNADNTSVGRIHMPEAWNLSTGSSNIVVGIIDTGILYTHIDLAANVWTNPGEIASNGIDDDGDGYIDDIHGIDAVNGDSDPLDDQSHGTAVAGTIGAVGNNSHGIAGINWNVKMIACKAFNASGIGYSSALVTCLDYMVKLKNQYGINLVATNNSYGGYPYLVSMYNAIAASRDADMAFIAGAGNNGTDNDVSAFYPANYNIDNVVSVGATDSAGNKAGFSNYGATSVHISAPGVSVLTTILGNQYGYFNGTSIATPHVTGAVALIRAYHPNYVYSQAIASVLSTGTSFPALAGKSVTGAILNVGTALAFDAPTPTPGSTPIPIQTVEPTPEPTQQPGALPNNKLDISAVNSKSQSKVSCVLSELSGMDYAAVSGHAVLLVIKGQVKKRRATTNATGTVNFVVRPPRGTSYSAHCEAKVIDPSTNKAKTVKSKSRSLKLKKS